MFSANAKSNFGAIFCYFVEFFGFSEKMVVFVSVILAFFDVFLGDFCVCFLCESALENNIFDLRNRSVRFRIE